MPGQIEQPKETELQQIISRLASQNSRYISNLQTLERLGHRMKDTSTPEKSPSQDQQKPNGIIYSINDQLDYFTSHNLLLEGIIEKFSSLI